MRDAFSTLELQRLLARPVRSGLGPDERSAFAGRRVLITGAGGSIGSALAREVAACRPAVLGLVDHSEHALFSIERELGLSWSDVTLAPHLADVTRRAALERAARDVRPHVVYHAAAYKHVTMAERAPAAAALVNVIGTMETTAVARAGGSRFVLISSDKAADPKGVMGATKRLAEILTLSSAASLFRPVVVRFGNVLGSSGSVLEVMRACVRRGQPIPLTDPEATRYFMTAEEAVALVMRADLIGRSGEIYWLDMGESVRLGDLAERVLALEAEAGYRRVGVEIIGLRPGEKRTETLSDCQLVFERTIHAQIRVAREARATPADLSASLRRLRRAVDRADDAAVLSLLTETVPGFCPSHETRAAAERMVVAPASPRPVRRRKRAA